MPFPPIQSFSKFFSIGLQVSRTEFHVYISTRQASVQVLFRFSVLGKSQTRLTTLTCIGQDSGNTCKLIPNSKSTFQKISRENTGTV